MKVFFTDLDNTLIYSHRHMVDEPVTWIETLNGHLQSFITQRTYSYYKKQKWLSIVPITTRTFQQYSRLQDLFKQLEWDEALICNGAIRVVNGIEDSVWTAESLHISKPSRISFQRAYEVAIAMFGVNSVVIVDPFMFYVKGKDVDIAYSNLLMCADTKQLLIYRDSRKVYCIPKLLNKGQAINRYKKRFGIRKCFAAGDSEFDIPMFHQADICFYPDALPNFSSKNRKIMCRGLFSDQICIELEKIRKEEMYCD